HPDELEVEHERVDDGSPAAREAPRGPLRDRPRHGQACRLARETFGLARWDDGTPRSRERGLANAPCPFGLDALGEMAPSCARARQRPAQAPVRPPAKPRCAEV